MRSVGVVYTTIAGVFPGIKKTDGNTGLSDNIAFGNPENGRIPVFHRTVQRYIKTEMPFPIGPVFPVEPRIRFRRAPEGSPFSILALEIHSVRFPDVVIASSGKKENGTPVRSVFKRIRLIRSSRSDVIIIVVGIQIFSGSNLFEIACTADLKCFSPGGTQG